MKNKIAWVLVVFLIVLLGGSGLIIFKLKNELDGKEVPKDGKQPVVETSSMEVLSIVDPLVTEIGDVLLIPSFLNDNEMNEVFFSGNNVSIKDFSDKQKLYMAVKTYLANKNDIDMGYCGDDTNDYHVIPKEHLKLFFEDTSYIDNLSTEFIAVGNNGVVKDGDNIKVCQVIYGVIGNHREPVTLKPIYAYKKDGYLYLGVKFLYYALNEDKSEMEKYYYDVYTELNDTKEAVETFDENPEYPYFNPDYSKYHTYIFKFKLDGNKYYFEDITVEATE